MSPTNGNIYKVLGKAILLASMSFSIGSVTMSSTFSVQNFSTSQEILQRAANALTQYLIIATIWTAGCSSLLYASYGRQGLLISVAANAAIMLWIERTYAASFKIAASQNGLQMPYMWRLS
ncbi:hypothetical protein D9Q98_004089 [Chlorella vulgaris]|uniref:Uncharacterized protein n=1 Tax=Chlorella vulgaris TaxID=3077 RepID=A0A9D4TRM9_CHLVU|nr:hypothetical protein D9Q98_004089 [Chlorella vulgaris]